MRFTFWNKKKAFFANQFSSHDYVLPSTGLDLFVVTFARKNRFSTNIFGNFTKTFLRESLYLHEVILYYISLINLCTIETVIVGSGVTF